MEKSIQTYIAIGLALIIFVPFVFGGQLFSQIFPFSMFRAGVPGGDTADTSGLPGQGDLAGAGAAAFSDPVTILDLQIGEGELAEPQNTVSVGYVGTRIDPDTGEEIIFDQNTERDSAFTFVLGSGQVIPGFDMGVTGMRVGGQRLVIIQPEMGYGDQQAGSIPPNTTLQFLIELYEVQK